MDTQSPPKDVNELAHSIGALFMNFAGFEHMLNLVVAAALKLTILQERTLVRGMMAKHKIELLEAYAKQYFTGEAYEALKDLTKEAKEIADFRNSIAHGLLTHDEEGQHKVTTFKGANRFDGKSATLSPEIALSFARKASELHEQFGFLLRKLNEEDLRKQATESE